LDNNGAPDMRYKDNQEAAASVEAQISAGGGEFSLIFLTCVIRITRAFFL
jgi:hypothetical protein